MSLLSFSKGYEAWILKYLLNKKYFVTNYRHERLMSVYSKEGTLVSN